MSLLELLCFAVGLVICAIAYGTMNTAPEGWMVLGGGLIVIAIVHIIIKKGRR